MFDALAFDHPPIVRPWLLRGTVLVSCAGALSCGSPDSLELTGFWSGQFQDEFHWMTAADTTIAATCEGDLTIWFNPSNTSISGVLGQDQRCRFGDGEWFEETNDGWIISDGALIDDEVWFITRLDAGQGLGTQSCEWQGRIERNAIAGRYECTFSAESDARANGTFTVSPVN